MCCMYAEHLLINICVTLSNITLISFSFCFSNACEFNNNHCHNFTWLKGHMRDRTEGVRVEEGKRRKQRREVVADLAPLFAFMIRAKWLTACSQRQMLKRNKTHMNKNSYQLWWTHCISYSPPSSSHSPCASAVASWYCWYSETRSFILLAASVHSFAQQPL